MKRILIVVLAVLGVGGLVFIMLGDSAPRPISDYWNALFGERQIVRADAGFADFRTESQRIEDSFACVRIAEKPGDEFNDRRRHCIIGEHRTARLTIYEPVGHDGLTKKVKLTWLDNLRNNARGRNAPKHADREDVRQAVRVLARIYMPDHEQQLMELFSEERTGIVSELPFTAVVTFANRNGFKHATIDVRDGNHELLAGSEERQARPGYQKCLTILGSIPPLKGHKIAGEPVPERSDLYVTYFLRSDRGDQFLCEIHNSGYYRIRVSQEQGAAFKVLAHGNLGSN